MGSEIDSCKLLVRKLNYDTTEEELKEFYSTWGSVENCAVVKNKETGKSRGFGFVRYVKASMVDAAMAARPHSLAGRTLEPHRSAPKEYSEKMESHHTVNEIYVGKMVAEISEEDLRKYFGLYGNIEKVSIPKGKEDGELRGFAVVTFDDYDPVDVTCYKKVHYINEKRVFISKFINKKDMEELKRRYGGGGGNDRNAAQGFANMDTSSLQSMLLQKVLEMNYQSSSGGGAMRNKRRGGYNQK